MKQFLLILLLTVLPLYVSGKTSGTTVRSTVQIGHEVSYSVQRDVHGNPLHTQYIKIPQESLEGLLPIGEYNTSTTSTVSIRAIKRGVWTFYVTSGSYEGDTKIWTVVDVIDISIPENITVKVGETYTYTPVIIDDKANTSLNWHSSDSSVLTVSNGTISAINPGQAIVTVTATNGVSASSYVTVKDILPEALEACAEMELTVGETMPLEYRLKPENTTNRRVRFESSNSNVVDVSPCGELNALSNGVSYITIESMADANVYAITKVIVKENILESDDTHSVVVSLDKTGIFSLNVPDATSLSFDFTPYSSLWVVERVDINGEQLSINQDTGTCITPIITDNATIAVKMLPMAELIYNVETGIQQILEDYKISLIDKILVIKGLKLDDRLEIFQIDGMKILTENNSSQTDMAQIELPSGVYLVIINNLFHFKVRIN